MPGKNTANFQPLLVIGVGLVATVNNDEGAITFVGVISFVEAEAPLPLVQTFNFLRPIGTSIFAASA